MIRHKRDGLPETMLCGKMPIPKDSTLRDSIYRTVLKQTKRSVVARDREKEYSGAQEEILLLIEAIYISSYGNINILVTLDSFVQGGWGNFLFFLNLAMNL